MKALSVRQPYASLIAAGLKTIETRTWSPGYRGPLLICSSKKLAAIDDIELDFCLATEKLIEWPDHTNWCNDDSPECGEACLEAWMETLPLGQALCVVDLVDCRPMTLDDENEALCQIYPGALSLVLENPRPLKPFLVKGKLGLWEYDDGLCEHCRAFGDTCANWVCRGAGWFPSERLFAEGAAVK